MRYACAVALGLLTACSAEPTTSVAAKPAIEARPASADAGAPWADPEADADCGDQGFSEDKLAGTATAPFDQIDVQLDSLPTFAITTGLAGVTSFSRLPEFTLYRDGTVLYPDDSDDTAPPKLVTTKLAPAEATALREHLFALGIEQLKSHADDCSCPVPSARGGAISVCAFDANYTLLRYRTRDGELRHLVTYAGFWNRRAIAKSVIEHLRSWRSPSATVFEPAKAALVVMRRDHHVDCTPLDPKLAPLVVGSGASGPDTRIRAVDGPDLDLLRAKIGSGGGRRRFCQGSASYDAFLYPALPGTDPSAPIAAWLRQFEP